jgi:hypothetical protein
MFFFGGDFISNILFYFSILFFVDGKPRIEYLGKMMIGVLIDENTCVNQLINKSICLPT